MKIKAMELQCQLLLYLNKRRYLSEMKTECRIFSEQQKIRKINKFPPLRFLLKVDIMDLLDLFADVGMFLIREPLKWQIMCNEILYACLQSSTEELNQTVQQDQCLALVRLQSLSKLLVQPNLHHYGGLVVFEGILIAIISNPTSYVYHTVWCCPEECEGSEVVLRFIPKTPPKCNICRTVLFENSGLRRCGEQVTVTFKFHKQCHSKNLTITDDLIPKLVLGLKYSIHAVVLKKLTTVWSLEEIMPKPTPLTCPVLKDIYDLHQACNGVPWKFVYCLASSIGVSVSPLNCFMHLKISLLISLCSVKASLHSDCEIVHVLVAGNDTGYVGKLMTEAARIADRSVFLGTSHASVSTSLLASSGGVCVLPLPLHVYNHKQTSLVLAALESIEVTTETAKTKLRSAVWAQGMDFKKIYVCNVASVFGTVCRGDVCEYSDEIIDYHLEHSLDTKDNSQEMQAMKELASYIDLVSGLDIAMDSSTENLLRKYFLAARKVRQRVVSAGCMRALVATCLTSARLCRRSVANIDDAVLAIWLHVSGSSEPRIAPEEYLQTPDDVMKLHKMMNKFKEWLDTFTACIIFG